MFMMMLVMLNDVCCDVFMWWFVVNYNYWIICL